MTTETREAGRPAPDQVLTAIADYVLDYKVESQAARETARYCLMDSLGCGMLALSYPACVKLLGPVVPGAQMRGGARVPGTSRQAYGRTWREDDRQRVDGARVAGAAGGVARGLSAVSPGTAGRDEHLKAVDGWAR